MPSFRREGAERPNRAGRLPDLRAGKSASQTDPVNSEGFERVADIYPQARSRDAGRSPVAGPTYWEQRILADERRATEIARRASEEMAKMYRAQYLRVVKEIDKLKAQIDYGKPLTRTQLWNYARWSKVEESLKGFVTEGNSGQFGKNGSTIGNDRNDSP